MNPNQPVPMLIDGQEREVEISQVPVMGEPDEKTLQALHKADRFKAEGRLQEAIDLLEQHLCQGGFFPPVALKVCNLLRLQERFDEAEGYLRLVKNVTPDHPVVQFNRAGLLLEQGHLEKAHEHLGKIDLDQVEEEVRDKVHFLYERIKEETLAELFGETDAMLGRYLEDERRKIEEKRLPTDPTLARIFKNMPAHWLTGICLNLDLEPAKRREERAQQILESMEDPNSLQLLLEQAQDNREPELLRYLLKRGGWARLNGVTRKFGSMEGDGFYWDEDFPHSTPGRLWALGLAAVGKANLGQRRERSMAIPVELRAPLARILGVSTTSSETGTFP